MLERKVLLISIWATLFFALLGVVFGIVSESSMIIFDGIYSLICVGLSFLSLLVQKQIECHKDDLNFPFGKAHFEPLLIIFKSLALIGMCLFSATIAVADILAGGREISAGPAIIYALIATIGCFVVTGYIQRKSRCVASGLLEAEKNQWLGDSLLSLGVLLGFTVSYMIAGGEFAWLVPYTDPGMVVIASSFFILFPLRSFFEAAREMIFCQVDDEFMVPIDNIAQSIANDYDAEYKLRMISVGRELTIEVNFLLAVDRPLSVSEMDEMRVLIAIAVKEMNKRYWINVSFTNSKLWL
ncbi:cation diffusion facilitator family transporter [Sinobacterium caligoides]|nr:cation transporter [Sinobacterium caligoides]